MYVLRVRVKNWAMKAPRLRALVCVERAWELLEESSGGDSDGGC